MENVNMNEVKGTIIETLREETCDNICKWPEFYLSKYKDPDEAHEWMLLEKCPDCPLNKYL